MDDIAAVLGLLLVTVTIAALCRRYGLSAPLVLVVAGLAATYVPGVPDFELSPEVALLLFLPPLLYSAALDSSYLGIRANLRPIAMLSVGAVLFTTVVVGLTVHALVPDIGWPLAFAIGAIVGPPDAVAATTIGRRLGLPRKVVTILAGESLVNDATALTALRVAVAVLLGGTFSMVDSVVQFVVAAAGGVAIGLLIAVVVITVNRVLDDPLAENTISLLTPFLAYLAAENELVHTSGVLSVVTVGLAVGHRSPRRSSYASRLQSTPVWAVTGFVLEGVVFALIGLQLPSVVGAMDQETVTPGGIVTVALLTAAVVIAARFVWVFPSIYFPAFLGRRLRQEGSGPPWQVAFVVSWAGMRGVVSLAAAFGLPLSLDDGSPTPGREAALLIVFVVVIVTLVVQGFSLPTVIRRLGVVGKESAADTLAEAGASQAAADAANKRLDEMLAENAAPVPADVVSRLRERVDLRALLAWERLGPTGPERRETPQEAFRRMRREMLSIERMVFVDLRDAGDIDDEVLRRVMTELDLEEALISR